MPRAATAVATRALSEATAVAPLLIIPTTAASHTPHLLAVAPISADPISSNRKFHGCYVCVLPRGTRISSPTSTFAPFCICISVAGRPLLPAIPGCCASRRERLRDEEDEPRLYDRRSCTNCGCCLLFTLAMSLFAAVGVLAFHLGDPRALVYGVNHRGERCGVGAHTHEPMLYHPRLAADLISQPTASLEALKLYGVCVARCPIRGDEPIVEGGERWAVEVSTTAVLHRCVPVAHHHTLAALGCVSPHCNSRAVRRAGGACAPLGFDGLWLPRSAAQRSMCVRQVTFEESTLSQASGAPELADALAHSAAGTMALALSSIDQSRGEVICAGIGLALLLCVVCVLVVGSHAPTALRALSTLAAASLWISSAVCLQRTGWLSALLSANVDQRASPHGVSPHGVSPHGVSPHGVSPHGVSPQGVSPQGVSPRSANGSQSDAQNARCQLRHVGIRQLAMTWNEVTPVYFYCCDDAYTGKNVSI